MAEFLTRLFDAWNVAQIRYLILRNYKNLPEYTGNDIDILLDPAQRRDAEKILCRTAGESGWLIHNIGEFACRAFYLFHRETREQVHIDLMCGIKWHALLFADHSVMLKRRVPFKNFYAPHPAHEAATNLMYRLIYGGYVKEAYREDIHDAVRQDPERFVEAVSPWIGAELAGKFAKCAARNQWPEIEAQTAQTRKRVWFANLRNPVKLGRSLINDVFRFSRRWLRSPGVFLVFFGPDGCGKTSVADQLKVELEKTFSPGKGLHCHWKPARSKKISAGPTTDPHGRSPRNASASLAFFIHHYLPFVWGWWIVVKPALFKNGLVIIDRYYYDFFVDQRRYRLKLPQWIVKLGFLFIKKPDLVFCLDAAPEVLQARKKEVSFEECRRQRETYCELAKRLPNGHVIDASQPLENVVQDVKALVLEFMAQRTETRTPR